MDQSQLLTDTKSKLTSATTHFKEEIKKIRTGRAHPGMLDGITVEVYGQQMPLKAVAGIAAPEAQLLQLTPFDPTNMKAISDAIRDNQNLGLNPSDDGRIIRIQIPPLNQETRLQMVKILSQKVEDCFITSRQIRHDELKKVEQAQKDKDIGKDEAQRLEKQIDELMVAQKNEVDVISKTKEHEILTI